MPLQEDYQVTLDMFRGPLDLLLFLIRRAELDIHDIPIAQVTDQYLAFLKQHHDIDIDVAGEFLVMAATLIEIKSRTLMPPEHRKGSDPQQGSGLAGDGGLASADPRFELVQQLLAYQKYRIASDELEARRIAFWQRLPCRPAKFHHTDQEVESVELELEDAHVFDLADAYERIISSIDLGKLGDHKVEIDDTPIALHQEDLLDRLSRADSRRLTLQEAFAGANAGQRIGLFLATLELVRLRRVTVTQPEIDGVIELVLNEDPSEALVIESDEIAHYGERSA